MAAPADYTNEQHFWAAIGSVDFQNRCVLQFAIAAVSITTEVVKANVNATTASGSATLHFASALSSNVNGYTVTDLTTPAAIAANTTILSGGNTATPVMNQNAVTPGIGAADLLQFSPPNHVARLALAGQILAGQFSPQQLAIWVVSNTTIQTEIAADFTAGNPPGTSVNDSDIAFQISSIFTGFATSLPTTAQSTI